MSHKTEAEALLRATMIEHLDPGEELSVDEALALIQAKATLALVEAQEAANEQARIANLIALGRQYTHEAKDLTDPEEVIANRGIAYVETLKPEIARVLGIEVAE